MLLLSGLLECVMGLSKSDVVVKSSSATSQSAVLLGIKMRMLTLTKLINHRDDENCILHPASVWYHLWFQRDKTQHRYGTLDSLICILVFVVH